MFSFSFCFLFEMNSDDFVCNENPVITMDAISTYLLKDVKVSPFGLYRVMYSVCDPDNLYEEDIYTCYVQVKDLSDLVAQILSIKKDIVSSDEFDSLFDEFKWGFGGLVWKPGRITVEAVVLADIRVTHESHS